MFGDDKYIADLGEKVKTNRNTFKSSNIIKEIETIIVIIVFFCLFVLAYPKVMIEVNKVINNIADTVNNMITTSFLK
ncbi:MAG: hypothetical protein RR290_01890 [Clostridia bacterium]